MPGVRAEKHSHGTGGGSHANTELGGQAELSHPCGDREDWWDTHTRPGHGSRGLGRGGSMEKNLW